MTTKFKKQNEQCARCGAWDAWEFELAPTHYYSVAVTCRECYSGEPLSYLDSCAHAIAEWNEQQ